MDKVGRHVDHGTFGTQETLKWVGSKESVVRRALDVVTGVVLCALGVAVAGGV
ncbi:hypothetical protein ACFY0P_41990 [Streptomyces sp. NPDC001714]|uniref:hypothetical protein n=1 Tax=Streptomyces sp. NPDC001714 TaxID=3364603 RepID=UPI00369DF18C